MLVFKLVNKLEGLDYTIWKPDLKVFDLRDYSCQMPKFTLKNGSLKSAASLGQNGEVLPFAKP